MKYETRLVAWLDILGFAQLIKDKEKFEIIKELRDDIERQIKIGPKIIISLISDTIAASIKLEDGAGADQETIKKLWKIVSELQCKLLFNPKFYECKIAFRGAIARGLAIHDHLGIYGPVIAELSEYEKSVAVYPRVILTNSLCSEIPSGLIGDLFLEDTDGFYYTNFLRYQHKDSTKKETFNADLPKLSDAIRERVSSYLDKSNYPVAAKWQWLHQYCQSYRATHLQRSNTDAN